jgi:hypothetical protein
VPRDGEPAPSREVTVVKWIRRFGAFWYDFVVGDDWRLAIGAIVGVTAADVASHHGANWWWLLPIAVVAVLGISLAHEVRRLR